MFLTLSICKLIIHDVWQGIKKKYHLGFEKMRLIWPSYECLDTLLLLLSHIFKLLVWYEPCIAAQEMDLYGRIKWRNWQQIKCVSDQYEILRNTHFSFELVRRMRTMLEAHNAISLNMFWHLRNKRKVRSIQK